MTRAAALIDARAEAKKLAETPASITGPRTPIPSLASTESGAVVAARPVSAPGRRRPECSRR